MNFDVGVIGAGVAGMTAALILAKRGYAVALVEAAPRVAPVLRGFKRKGVGYDTGFHYGGCLDAGQSLDNYFRYLGLAPELELAAPRAGLIDTFRAPGFSCDFPYGYDALRQTLGRRFPAERAGLERYLDTVRGLFETNAHCNPSGLADAHCAARAVADRYAEKTLNEVMDGWLQDRELKAMLGMHALLYGADPSSVSFTDHARFVGSYYQSAHRILGGGRSLAMAYEKALAAAKVTVLTRRRVAAILAEERAAGAELAGLRFEDGQELRCRIVVATIHPGQVAALAPEPTFRQVYRRRLAQTEDTFSAYAVFAATTRPIPLLERGNLHVARAPGFHLDRPSELPLEQRPLFLAQSVFADMDAARSGVALLCPASLTEVAGWSASRVGRRPASYRAFKAEAGRRLLEAAIEIYPELSGGLEPVAVATPLTFRDYSHSPLGSLYGLLHGAQSLPPLPVTRLKGLYLGGQAVTGPGVLGAVISAFIACGAFLGVEALLEEVRRCRANASS